MTSEPAETLEPEPRPFAWVAAIVAFGAWALVVALAWPTWLGMNPAAGAIAALADAALHGRAPGVDDGGTFLGTLYDPPFPLAVAGLRHAGLGWKEALRGGSLLSALVLLAGVVAVVRATGGRAVAVAAALALLVASFPFQSASLSGRADALAAGLTLLALAAWCRAPGRLGWPLAAWCAAAWLVKATACAVPLAIVLASLARREGRALPGFAARVLVAMALGVLVTQPFHGAAWYLDVLRTMILAPPRTTSLVRGPAELLRYVASYAELAVIAAFAIAEARRGDRALTPWRWTMAVATAIAVTVLTNRQSDHNHLLEATALAAIGAGRWVAQARRAPDFRALTAAALAIVVLAASWRAVDSMARASRRPEARREAVLAAVRATKGETLTEDPLLSLAAGRPAPVSDPAVLRSLAAIEDPRALRVIDDLERGRWSLVVLATDLEANAEGWYRDFHFGARATRAIVRRYVDDGGADDYRLRRRADPRTRSRDGTGAR